MDASVLKNYERTNAWGMSIGVDLRGCDFKTISEPILITNFVAQLVAILKMRSYGETQLHYFGDAPEVKGYTMVQLIQTSLISGHFVELDSSAHIDIFSCKPFDPKAVMEFSQAYFKASEVSSHVSLRR